MAGSIEDLSSANLITAPPLLPWSKFAEWIQVEPGIVRGWVLRGYLPSYKVGRHTFINVELLRTQLLESDI